MACLVGVLSECPTGFTRNHKGSYTTYYCYRHNGDTKYFHTAVSSCNQEWGTDMIMPKDGNGLDDLYKLYKSYSNYYIWV